MLNLYNVSFEVMYTGEIIDINVSDRNETEAEANARNFLLGMGVEVQSVVDVRLICENNNWMFDPVAGEENDPIDILLVNTKV